MPGLFSSTFLSGNFRNKIRDYISCFCLFMFGLSVNHAYAGPGIFINDGTDDGCIWTFDKEDYSPIGDYFGNTAPADKDSAGRNSPASVKYHIPSIQQLGGAATLKCLSKDRDTQTDRVLFYGNSKEQGSISLTLGGELFVNNGNLGLGGGTDTKAMRIGSMATLTGPSGLRSLAIGAGEIATVASGDDAIAIGTAAQAAHVGSIALGLQSTTELPSLVKDVTINGIKLSAFAGSNPASVLSIGNDTLKRSITNVGAGRVSKDSTDAVNGSQLYAVAEQATLGWNLTANGTDKSRVSPGDTVDLSNSDGNFVIGKHGTGVTFNLASDLKVTSLVAGNTFLDTNGLVITGGPSMTVSGIDAGHLKISHIANGAVTATSTDAVNGRQLFAVSEQAASGWSLTVNGMDKSRVGPGDTVDLSNSDGNLVLSKKGKDVTFNLASDLKVTSLVAGNTFLDTNGLVITGGPSMTVSGIDAGQLKISHVADGTVTSTDAVNGSQLHRVAHTIAEHLGGDAHVNADGSVIGPQYTVQKKRYKTIYDAFGGVDENLANINDILHDIESGGGIKYFHANSIGADSRALGTNSIAVGSDSVASGEGSISVGNGAQASAHGSVALGENAAAPDANSVALGAGSKTSEVVATKGTTINGQYYDFAGDAPSGTVSVGDKGAERTITNVAAGRISVESTDAVNGSQLNAVNQAIENLAAGVTENDKFSVKYDRHSDGTKKNSMTLQGWDSATPVVLANVADGVHKNDAVNVSQLKAGLSTTLGEAKAYTDQTALQTLDQANAYTDKKFGKLNEDIVATRIEARQAAAIGLAAASLRYDDRPGKISAAIGGGFWRGEGAVALGLGHTSEDQRMRSNLSAATSGGNWGMGAGFSYTFN
ncbi:outer membrane protein [Brucella ceti TE28753-12]|uniref:Surface protein n=2 Tax=Brucella ceti TaxID=120577 RepID=A0ABM9ZC53_9HYPH|nr:YadA-like family protein [Brucella ceti]AHB00218.1 outer membrane protein [Brucella ceti TE10759-12]AHB02700.1 outer membrane protein [Brucella ceti TE28753-12]EEX97264.1 surface protein [Brucella ceti M644/93/1]